MIQLSELKLLLKDTFDIVKMGEPLKKTFSHGDTKNDVMHQHYVTYTSRFNNLIQPRYHYYSRHPSIGDSLISEIEVESYKDIDNVGKSFIFIEENGGYQFHLYPKSMDEIEFRIPGIAVQLLSVLDPATHFQMSTIYDIPSIEFLQEFHETVQELRSTMTEYKYKTKCVVRKDMTTETCLDGFSEKIKGAV